MTELSSCHNSRGSLCLLIYLSSGSDTFPPSQSVMKSELEPRSLKSNNFFILVLLLCSLFEIEILEAKFRHLCVFSYF